ncbi:MAG: WD40 repeat domain-containing protein [Candidatus Thorarchaeota archaeon]|jgi:WD40 repeat protein
MESRELSLFLKRKTLKPEAAVAGDITRRFAMNSVGRMVAAAQQDRTIRLYDAQDCDEMQRMQDDVLCTSIAFSPKGDIIATGSVGRVVKLWDIRHGTPIATLEGHAYPVLALAFSPDGSKLVSGSGDTTLIIWDVDKLEQLHHLKGHSLYVVSCAWDPSGSRIVSSSVDASICEWDANTGELLAKHEEHRTAVQVVRFSRNGKRLASGSSDNTIVLWDASGTLKPETTLRGHNSEVRAVSFSHDGKYLASGSADKDLFVWSFETNSIEGESTTPSEIDGIEWYPDSLEFITSDGTGAIARWEVVELDAILAPFNELLKEIESDPEMSRCDELTQKFEEIRSQYSEEVLQDKRLFYVNWQCKKALGLLKGTVKK